MFLDTTFCIDLLRENHRGEDGTATRKLRSLGNMPVTVSVFVICELQAGARLSGHPGRELRKVEIFADNLAVVYPDSSFPVVYGEIVAHLRKKGRPIPVMDVLIGAMAKQRGAALLTRDADHYGMIPGLVLEMY